MATRREKWHRVRDEYRVQLYCRLHERDKERNDECVGGDAKETADTVGVLASKGEEP